jgi:Holliday junction resolvase
MANPSKQKGTKAETAVVRYLEFHGYRAKRNALHGNADEGDIMADIGGLDVCIEVKNRKRIELAKWMGELSREKENAGADCGVLVIKPEGTGLEKVGKWWVVMEFDEFRWGR